MLLALKSLEYEVRRLGNDFSFGLLVRERSLEDMHVRGFDFRFNEMIVPLIELKAITKGASKVYVEESLKVLGQCKQNVMKLAKDAAHKNEDLSLITQRLNVIIKRKKKTVESVKLNVAETIDLIVSLQEKHPSVSDVIPKMKDILAGGYKDTKEDISLLNNDLEEVFTYLNDFKVKNGHLEEVIHAAFKKIDDAAYLLQDEHDLELEDFVHDISKHAVPSDVFDEIGKKIRITRETTMFEKDMYKGSRSLSIKSNIRGTFPLVTYGTDPDVEACREAKTAGIDFVAKKGIYQMTHSTFDITLNFLDAYTFYTEENRYTLPEESEFSFIFSRSVPKSNGYVIFSIPYFKLPLFQRRIKSHLTIEGAYRVDDAIKNVLFICRYKHNNRSDKQLFNKIALQYDKLPHYTDMKEMTISGGDVTHPKTFRAYFVDQEDLFAAFAHDTPTFDLIEQAYRPKEKVIELNRPLQEYREGHLPAVATIEIVNGVYDDAETNFPNIYSTKIVQQDVEEEKEEMYKGQLVKVISQKKKNVIVSKILLPNGEITELLNTK